MRPTLLTAPPLWATPSSIVTVTNNDGVQLVSFSRSGKIEA